jgi:hypothetical protein
MQTRGELRIDPCTLSADEFAGELELVVPYVGPEVTRVVLDRAAVLTAGLNARIALVAVQALPYPSQFVCPTAIHAYLVDHLTELAEHCPIRVESNIVLARSREEGFRHALKTASTVLVGTPRRFWHTSEERLARMLAADGHNVALLHIS